VCPDERGDAVKSALRRNPGKKAKRAPLAAAVQPEEGGSEKGRNTVARGRRALDERRLRGS